MRGKINLGKAIKFILIAAGLFVIGIAVFTFFKVHSNAKNALRDAKNVYLALYTTDIEYYAQGKTIYDHSQADGLAEGVKEKVKRLADSDGAYIITSYSKRNREITGMQYRSGHYLVTFTKKDGREIWTVDYSLRIYRVTDE